MKVLYSYQYDAADINTQSGRPKAILDQLRRHGIEIIEAFPLSRRWRYLYSQKYLWYRLRGQVYRSDREPGLLRSFARQVERRLARTGADCLFEPGSLTMSALEVDLPKVMCADATFRDVIGAYDSFKGCAETYLRQGERAEKRALNAIDAAIYPSEWAAATARDYYEAEASKIHVIPFGANVTAPDRSWVEDRIAARALTLAAPRFLFIGRDWARKGGATVLETCDALRRSGVDASLDIVGITDKIGPLPDYVRSHGLLNKNDPQDKARLDELLSNAHFMFVPSLAENYGMTFCEAAAFGLPSLARDVGGISAIVKQGNTGILLTASDDGEAFASEIIRIISEPALYTAMAAASVERFHTHLTWDAFGNRLYGIIRKVCGVRSL